MMNVTVSPSDVYKIAQPPKKIIVNHFLVRRMFNWFISFSKVQNPQTYITVRSSFSCHEGFFLFQKKREKLL